MFKILIDIVPAKGHIHATIKMAALLKQAGHQVTYALPIMQWIDTEKYGFLSATEVPIPQLNRMHPIRTLIVKAKAQKRRTPSF